MPYFREQEVLFVHIPKNAGKSVEVALGLAGKQRLGDVGRRPILNRMATLLRRRTANRDAADKLHGALDVSLCAQHLTLQEIMLLGLVSRHRLEAVRSFAVFRNPYERALSTYKHFTGKHAVVLEDFETFCGSWYAAEPVDHNARAHKRQQMDFLRAPDGSLGVDRILSFENLAADFNQMCQEWSLRAEPLEQVGRQGKAGQFREIATSRTEALIRAQFPDDVAYFEAQSSV